MSGTQAQPEAAAQAEKGEVVARCVTLTDRISRLNGILVTADARVPPAILQELVDELDALQARQTMLCGYLLGGIQVEEGGVCLAEEQMFMDHTIQFLDTVEQQFMGAV